MTSRDCRNNNRIHSPLSIPKTLPLTDLGIVPKYILPSTPRCTVMLAAGSFRSPPTRLSSPHLIVGIVNLHSFRQTRFKFHSAYLSYAMVLFYCTCSHSCDRGNFVPKMAMGLENEDHFCRYYKNENGQGSELCRMQNTVFTPTYLILVMIRGYGLHQ